MAIRTSHLDILGWHILKSTLEQKRTVFLFADHDAYESMLGDLRAVAHTLSAPVVKFDGEAHKITHNLGCDNEISTFAYTIYGEVQD